MAFSILFEKEKKIINHQNESFIHDLNIDTIINEISYKAANKVTKNLFFQSLNKVSDIEYRQEIFKDLENPIIFDAINSFKSIMSLYHHQFIENQKSKYPSIKLVRQKQNIAKYIEIIKKANDDFLQIEVKSKGLKAFKAYLNEYTNSDAFNNLINETKIVCEKMSNVKYILQLDKGVIRIAPYEKKVLMRENVFSTFDEFNTTHKKEYSVPSGHISELMLSQIYDTLIKYYKDEFDYLKKYWYANQNFFDKEIENFIFDIDFYFSYLSLVNSIKEKMNLPFCYPTIKEKIASRNGFDLALACNYLLTKKTIVKNDILLKAKEEIMIVSGPNQGGKTTYSRYFGQSLYLASLGLPITGSEAELPLIKNIYTIFEVEENAANLNGKLQSELNRIKTVMDNITSDDCLIMNEVFSSTSYIDGITLGKKIIEKINDKHVITLYVTFLDELANVNETTISLKSLVDKDNPEKRIYKIERSKYEYLGYGMAIAKNNEMTKDDIVRRMKK